MKAHDPMNEAEKALGALDNLQRANVGGDFEKELFQKISFLPKPVQTKWLGYSAAAMIVLALLNMGTLMSGWPEEGTQLETTDELADGGLLYESIDYLEFE